MNVKPLGLVFTIRPTSQTCRSWLDLGRNRGFAGLFMEAVIVIAVAAATGLCVLAWNAPPLLKNVVRTLYSVLVLVGVAIVSWSAGYKSGLGEELRLTVEQADSFAMLSMVGLAAIAAFLLFLEFVIAAWAQDNRNTKD